MPYIANIKIEKVEPGPPGQKRSISEAVNLTVKADTLEKLNTKVAAHMSLLDEEDLS